MPIKKVSMGLALLSAALQSTALTIGSPREAVWIGERLELSVPVLRDVQSGATELCAQADVVYGDSQLDVNHVQVQQTPTEQADTAILWVRSSTPVNEPVVSVILRVGCEQKSERRFVLLADLPIVPVVTEMPPVLAPAELAEPPAKPKPQTAAAATPAPRTHEPAKRQKTFHVGAPITQPHASTRGAKPSNSRGSRLRLDPLEDLIERVRTLETTTVSAPAAVPVPAPPESVSQEAQRVQQLEGELQSLRLKTATNEATLLSMRKRLEQAESERVSTSLFYGLLAVVVLCAVAIVALWQRRRTPAIEQEDPSDEPEPYEAQFLHGTVDPAAFEPPPVRMPAPKTAPKVTTTPLDVNVEEIDELEWSDIPSSHL